jgi:hypothetical protein
MFLVYSSMSHRPVIRVLLIVIVRVLSMENLFVCANLAPCVGVVAVVLIVWSTMATVLERVRCAIGWGGGTGVGSGVLLGWLLTTLGGAATASLNVGWLFATLGSGILVVAGDGLCVLFFPG